MNSDEDIDDFYRELEEVLNDSPKKDIKAIMGDWNAKIGRDRDGWDTVVAIWALCGGEQSPHLNHDFMRRPTDDLAIDNDSLMFSV